MSRTPLPNRRPHETVRFRHWNMQYIAGLGRAHNSAPVTEVFINVGKSGEQLQTLARDSAVLVSLGLQYGVPIEVMRKAIMRDLDGQPSGPIGRLIDILAEEQ